MASARDGRRKATILRDALVILRKELRNVFRDRRAIFANYLLPLILMPIIFTAMGFFQGQQESDRAAKTYTVDIRNAPDGTFAEVLGRTIRFLPLDPSTPADPSSTEWLTVVFPGDFDEGSTNTVTVHFNSTSNAQSYAARMIRQAVDAYEEILRSQLLAEVGLTLDSLNILPVVSFDTAPPESQGANVLAVLLPYMIIIYIFAGSMAMGLDTTAGEKERGGQYLFVSRSAHCIQSEPLVFRVRGPEWYHGTDSPLNRGSPVGVVRRKRGGGFHHRSTWILCEKHEGRCGLYHAGIHRRHRYWRCNNQHGHRGLVFALSDPGCQCCVLFEGDHPQPASTRATTRDGGSELASDSHHRTSHQPSVQQ